MIVSWSRARAKRVVANGYVGRPVTGWNTPFQETNIKQIEQAKLTSLEKENLYNYGNDGKKNFSTQGTTGGSET